MKHKPKYLAEKEPAPKKKLPILWIVVAVVAVALVLVAVLLPKGGPGKNIGSGQPAEETTPTEPQITIVTDQVQEMPEKVTSVDTTHGPLQFDETYTQELIHEEVTEDGVTMEVFSMVAGEDRWELFRICYGEVADADPVGALRVEGQLIPVSVKTCSYDREDFPDEATFEMHYTLMDQLNVILAGIRADSNFVAPGSQTGAPTQVQEAKASYWTVDLPESITWEETTSGNIYRVDYYGTIGGKKVHLYAITLGDPDADSILGTYTTDQGGLAVGVWTYDHENQNTWEKDSQYQTYILLMETINDVIEAITTQESFSETL